MTFTSDPQIDALLDDAIARGDFPSAVYLVAEEGEVICANALGQAVRSPERHDAHLDTIYDLASLTKPLVTSLIIMQHIEARALNFDTPVSRHLHEFCDAPAERITVGELLTHTAGLPAWRPLYADVRSPDAASVLRYIAACGGEYPPGSRVVYSDFGFITLGFLLERLASTTLAQLAAESIFKPLNLRRTFFNPPATLQKEIAASEIGNGYEREMCRNMKVAPDFTAWREGVVWGEVHDGNAHFLGGAAGHAGLFSTATETMHLAQQFLPNFTKSLAPALCIMFQSNSTKNLNEARSVGWQLAATPDSTAGESLPPQAFGHTGFAGTSLWIDPERERIFILLTNRTHDRALPFANINAVRRYFHTLAVKHLDAQASTR